MSSQIRCIFKGLSVYEDLDTVAHLIIQSDPFIYRDLFGSVENLTSLLPLLLTKNGIFSSSNYILLKCDDEIAGLAALYVDNPQWEPFTVEECFYRLKLPIPESFGAASEYFEETFNLAKVGLNACNIIISEPYRGKGMGD